MMEKEEDVIGYECAGKFFCSRCPSEEFEYERDLLFHLSCHGVEKERMEIIDIGEAAKDTYLDHHFKRMVKQTKKKFKEQSTDERRIQIYQFDEERDIVVHRCGHVKITPRPKREKYEGRVSLTMYM